MSDLWPYLEVTHTSEQTGEDNPPLVTAEADRTILWPPNGRSVTVNVGGTVADESAVVDAWLTVEDEYGEVGGERHIAPDANGCFVVSADLVAWRDGGGRNGRVYTLTVYAVDEWGNRGLAEPITVRAPHDRRGK